MGRNELKSYGNVGDDYFSYHFKLSHVFKGFRNVILERYGLESRDELRLNLSFTIENMYICINLFENN